MIYQIMNKAIESKSTDIHLKVGNYPVFRINGDIEYIKFFNKLSLKDLRDIKEDLLERDLLSEYKKKKYLDFSFTYKKKRIRGHIYRQRNFPFISLRLLSKKIPSLDSLGLPKKLAYFTKLNSGLVLITGKTGVGKSTTLAAIVDQINRNFKKKISTIENPIEYIYEDRNSIVEQRELGKDIESYADGIRSILRSDPDVIVLGESRGIEEIEALINLAETGHLVFSTLHTSTVTETMDRLIDIFPASREKLIKMQLANNLEGIICQNLYRNKFGGMVPNCEILVTNPAIRNLIKNGSNSNNILDLIYMDRDRCQGKLVGLKELYEKGEIDLIELKKNLTIDEYKKFKSIL